MEKTYTIRLNLLSGITAKQQITEHLRSLLVEGKLVAGSVLPSVRRLAMELGVHFNTVAEAYRELAAEGWLELRHGRAASVRARTAPVLRQKAWLREFQDRLRGLVTQMRSDGAPAEEIAAELRAAAKAVTRRCA